MTQNAQSPVKTTLSSLRAATPPPDMRAGFDTVGGFELMQRGARLLSSSTIVPAQYRSHVEKKVNGGIQRIENPAAMSNCVVALNMAQRLGADPLMIMQNLYIVEGRPSWSSQYIIASINACGKYSPLRFSIEELGEKDVEYIQYKWEGQYPDRHRVENSVKSRIQDKRCIAWAIEKATGEKLESPPVTIELAVKEGWFGKEGSKWQTMPDVMLRYRAASFFGKLYAPELLMGLQSTEEIHDTTITIEPEYIRQSISLGDVNPTPTAKTQDGETVPLETGEAPENAKSAETRVPEAGGKEDRQAASKQRAAQLATLSALRAETKAAWEATGAQVEEAEALVNAFAPKWTTAQCQRIQDEIKKRRETVVSPPMEAAQPTIACPMEQGEEIYLSACETCPEKGSCPDIKAYRESHS